MIKLHLFSSRGLEVGEAEAGEEEKSAAETLPSNLADFVLP